MSSQGSSKSKHGSKPLRYRSDNWEGVEKQLLCSVLKEHSRIIENKSLDTYSNKMKRKAWAEVDRKFNELNGRKRTLNQIKVQWKQMKVEARRNCSTHKKELHKTGGGVRPTTPNEMVFEISDLLNPAELLRDCNVYDSDGLHGIAVNQTELDLHEVEYEFDTSENESGIIRENQPIADAEVEYFEDIDSMNETVHAAGIDSMNEMVHATDIDSMNETVHAADIDSMNETVQAADIEPRTEPVVTVTTGQISTKIGKRKSANLSESNKSKKGRDDYISSMIDHSKILKNQEHARRMEMAEEQHAIQMRIHEEELKCAILKREIMELNKLREEKLVNLIK